MTGGQQIVENGKVSLLFQWIVGVSITITAAMLIWGAATLNRLVEQVTVLNTNYTHSQKDHREYEREHTELHRRISELERQWAGQRNDSRE